MMLNRARIVFSCMFVLSGSIASADMTEPIGPTLGAVYQPFLVLPPEDNMAPAILAGMHASILLK